MKNKKSSNLHRMRRAQVTLYKEISDRVKKIKLDMSYLWKYKKDYPADWKRLADMLSDDKEQIAMLKLNIRSLKNRIRESDTKYTKQHQTQEK